MIINFTIGEKSSFSSSTKRRRRHEDYSESVSMSSVTSQSTDSVSVTVVFTSLTGSIYHGCHEGCQLRFIVEDANLVDMVIVFSIRVGEDGYLFLLPPASTFLDGVQGSPGLWAGQPGSLPVHPPYLPVYQVEGIFILEVLGAVEHL